MTKSIIWSDNAKEDLIILVDYLKLKWNKEIALEYAFLLDLEARYKL